jgi:hypothetical protein
MRRRFSAVFRSTHSMSFISMVWPRSELKASRYFTGKHPVGSTAHFLVPSALACVPAVFLRVELRAGNLGRPFLRPRAIWVYVVYANFLAFSRSFTSLHAIEQSQRSKLYSSANREQFSRFRVKSETIARLSFMLRFGFYITDSLIGCNLWDFS